MVSYRLNLQATAMIEINEELEIGGHEWCLRQAFEFVWPWPLTPWPPKLNISCPYPVDHLWQLAPYLFSI